MLKGDRLKRQKKVRGKIKGVSNSPRISVFRSNRYILAQAIDDSKGQTIAFMSERDLKEKSKVKSDQAKEVGIILAGKLKKLKIEKIVFDRGAFRYHGRVKSLAEGLREGGMKF